MVPVNLAGKSGIRAVWAYLDVSQAKWTACSQQHKRSNCSSGSPAKKVVMSSKMWLGKQTSASREGRERVTFAMVLWWQNASYHLQKWICINEDQVLLSNSVICCAYSFGHCLADLLPVNFVSCGCNSNPIEINKGFLLTLISPISPTEGPSIILIK